MAHTRPTDGSKDPTTSSGKSTSFLPTPPVTPSIRNRAKRVVDEGLISDLEHGYESFSTPFSTISRAISENSEVDDSLDSLDSQKPRSPSRLRAVTQLITATHRLRRVQQEPDSPRFKIGRCKLQNIMRERQLHKENLTSISEKLHTNLGSGLHNDDSLEARLEERRSEFGSNKLPSRPLEGILEIISKELLKKTSIVLMVAAVASLGVQMKADGPARGWYDGTSIFIALGIDFFAKAYSDYRKFLLLQTLDEEKKMFQVEVIGNSRPCKISVFDIVVGDIVTIANGNQVPADGILVSGQSTVDEWRTAAGRSVPDQPVHHDRVLKHHKTDPFLLSGSKVVDGYGVMLVLAVGVNTMWGSQINYMSTLSGIKGDIEPTHDQASGFPRSDAQGEFRDSLRQNSIFTASVSEVRGEDLPSPVSTASISEVPRKGTPRESPLSTPSEALHWKETDPLASHQVVVLVPPVSEVNGRDSSRKPRLNARADFRERVKKRVRGCLSPSTHRVHHGEKTPLQKRLKVLAKFLLWAGASVNVLAFIADIGWYFATEYWKNYSTWRLTDKVLYNIAFLVSSLLLLASEVLPSTVSLIVAYSLRKMKAEKLMIRNVAACEMMGAVTTICSNKTGTLTSNQMTVKSSVMVVKNSVIQMQDFQGISTSFKTTLFSGICQNSCGRVVPDDDGEPLGSGMPTEAAVLTWGLQMGMVYDDIKRTTSTIHVEAFNSAKRRAGVILQRTDGDRALEAHWKGAPDVILEKSAKWLDVDGDIHSMNGDLASELKTRLKYATDDLSEKGLRCIAFAYRPLMHTDPKVPDTEEERQKWENPFHDDLTFLCVLGIENPFRPGVHVTEAVEKCRAAQIKVRMVTGDSLSTAKVIAAECGILTSQGIAVEGCIFRDPDVNTEDIHRVLSTLDVLAVSSPSDKLRLVRELKNRRPRGEVVAVTGGGTKDSLALCEADLGLAMGALGTEVAEQSGIVILDDDFASIVKAIPWGRSVYANIQKFFQFQLTLNFTALVLNLVPSVSTGSAPCTVVQLLWMDLIMDTLGALALATEEPTEDLMKAGPVDRTEPLITNITLRNVFISICCSTNDQLQGRRALEPTTRRRKRLRAPQKHHSV